MGYTVKATSAELVELGYDFLKLKQYAKAEFFFEQLVKKFSSGSEQLRLLG